MKNYIKEQKDVVNDKIQVIEGVAIGTIIGTILLSISLFVFV